MKESGCVYSGSFLFQRTLRRKEINEMTEYNMLKDFNFQDIETKRIRTVGYKSDHNTPCRHFYNAWPLEKVLGEDRYSDLYLVLIDAAVQNGGTDYNVGITSYLMRSVIMSIPPSCPLTAMTPWNV